MKGLLWIPALALCLQVSSKAIPPGAASDVLSGEDDLDQTIASLSKSLPKTLSVKLAGLVSDNFNEAWCLAEDVKTLSGECHPLKLAAALSSDIFSPAVSSFAPVLKRELQSGVEEFHAMNHPSAPSTLSNAKWKAKVWAHSMKRAKRLQNLLATHVTRHTKGLSSDVKVLQKQLKKKTCVPFCFVCA